MSPLSILIPRLKKIREKLNILYDSVSMVDLNENNTDILVKIDNIWARQTEKLEDLNNERKK